MGRWGMGKLRLQIWFLMGDILICYVAYNAVKSRCFIIDFADARLMHTCSRPN